MTDPTYSLVDIITAAANAGMAKVTVLVPPATEAEVDAARARLPAAASAGLRVVVDEHQLVEPGRVVVLRGWPNPPTLKEPLP